MDSVRAYFLGLSPKTEYPHAPNAKPKSTYARRASMTTTAAFIPHHSAGCSLV